MSSALVTVAEDGFVSVGAEGDLKAENLECDRFPGWRFSLDLAPHGIVTRLVVDAPGGISARKLQDVPLGTLRDAVARQAVEDMRYDFERAKTGAIGGIQATPGLYEHFLEVAEDMPAAPIDGKRNDGWYVAHVAVPYVDAERRGAKPNQAVADHLRRLEHRVTDSTVRGYVYECRNKRKLLAPTVRGKAGSGGLTRKAERIARWLEEEGTHGVD